MRLSRDGFGSNEFRSPLLLPPRSKSSAAASSSVWSGLSRVTRVHSLAAKYGSISTLLREEGNGAGTTASTTERIAGAGAPSTSNAARMGGHGGASSSGGGTDRPRTSAFGGFLNLLRASMGPGCLAVASGISECGVVLGSITFLFLQLACGYCQILLIQCKKSVEGKGVQSYGDLAQHVFGPRGRVTVNVFVCLQQLGICCVYFNFVSTNLKAVIPKKEWDPNARLLDLIAFPMFAVLAQLRSMKQLVPFSFGGNVLILAGIGLLIFLTMGHAIEDGVSEVSMLRSEVAGAGDRAAGTWPC